MKSITIHNLESDLARMIEEMAAQSGLSQNKLIKRLLRSSLGLDHQPAPPNDFERFCGIWSAEEMKAFDATQPIFDKIDDVLWQ